MLSFLVPLVVYALSARRDVWFWDTGEMDTVPWILGIAHPTGFPAYVLAGFAFSHLVPFGSVAFRMSLMSAVAMAAAAWFVARIVEDQGIDAWIGCACAWLFAFGSIVWTIATRADVHAAAACAVAATTFFALRWRRTGASRDAYAGALAFGTGLAIHPLVALVLPGLAVLVVARARDAPARAALLRAVPIAVAAAAVWYVYLPLRSAYVSAHNVDPLQLLGIGGGAFWDYDHPASWRGFFELVSGGAFDPWGSLSAVASRETYAALPVYAQQLYAEVTSFGVSMAVGGAVAAWMRDRVRTTALLLLGLFSIPFGLAFSAESDPHRYFITSFVVIAVLCGDAAAWLRARAPWKPLPTLVIAAIAVAVFVGNRWAFGFASDENARAVIDDVRRFTPDRSIIVANWLDAPPLAYAAYVERSLGGRIVEPAWLDEVAPKLRRWMRARPLYAIGADQSALGFRLTVVGHTSSLSRVEGIVATH